MVLMLIAELLGGETRVSPGGPIDTATAAAEDEVLWATPGHQIVAAVAQVEVEAEIIGVPAGAPAGV
jgi:hypothetical protein